MRRLRSNDGVHSHVEVAIPLRPELIYAVLGAPPPLIRAEKFIYHGPKRPRGSPKPRATDEQVLEMRRLHRDHTPYAEIAAATGFDINYVTTIVRYLTRVHLDPGAA